MAKSTKAKKVVKTKLAKKTAKKPAKKAAVKAIAAKAKKPAKPAKKKVAAKKTAKTAKPVLTKKMPKAPAAFNALMDLFRKKPETLLTQEQIESENHELWKHKKNLPPHDTAKQTLKAKIQRKDTRGKSGGFGSRHH